MKNGNLEDKMFDTILKQAFTDENEREMSRFNINEESLNDYKPSNKHKRAMKKMVHKHIYSSRTLSLSKKIQRVAVIFLVVIGMGTMIMSISPNVRAAYQQAIIQLFGKYNLFDFETASGYTTVGEYSMAYLPEGFTIVDSVESQSRKTYYFEDSEENYIHFSYMTGDLSLLFADNEEREYRPVEINSKEAYLLESVNDNIMIIWVDNDIVFQLSSNINTNELTKIAKNIK